MEGTAHFALGGFVRAVGQVTVQHLKDFVGLFEEDFTQLVVNRRFIAGRRQQTARTLQGRRVEARSGAGQRIEPRLAWRGVAGQDTLGCSQCLAPGFFLRQIAQLAQGLSGQFQDFFARSVGVLEHAFQVVFKAADHVGKARQLRLSGRGVIDHQLLINVIGTPAHQARRARQWNHRQGAAHLAQQLRQGFQALAVPVGLDAVDHQFLGLAQALTGFADHQLVDLGQVGGRQAAVFTALRFDGADHSGQRGLDVEQRPGDVHQYGVTGFALPLDQTQYHGKLVDDDFARLAETEHRQGVGDLPQRCQQRVQVLGMLAVAAHEQIEALLDPYQLFAQCAEYRAHGVAVRPGQARALGIDHGTVGQGLIQTVAFLETLHARRRPSDFGDVEQQALEQFIRRRLVDPADALRQQALELLAAGLEQAAQCRAVGDHTRQHAFDQRRGDLPQRQQRRALAQRFQAREDPRHVFQVARPVVLAQQPGQGLLQQRVPLAQLRVKVRRCALGQCLVGQRRDGQQLRAEQAGLRQQAFTAGAAQVVEQRQHHQRQVATGAVHAVQVQRQLAEGLLQQADTFVALADVPGLQRQGQGFDLFSQQRRAVELDHLQRAMYLVDTGQARLNGVAGFNVNVQRRTGLLQGFGNIALDPFEGHVVVPINHNCSAWNSWVAGVLETHGD
ncbi:hypothetical protein [Pseudomonas sp. 34 E 7]|nr:hypothetical protein [Pseudomonas sp. 34 E 7]